MLARASQNLNKLKMARASMSSSQHTKKPLSSTKYSRSKNSMTLFGTASLLN